MERLNSSFEMRLRRLTVWVAGVSVIVVVWKLWHIESGIDRILDMKKLIELQNVNLNLLQQQLPQMENQCNNRGANSRLPTIYAVTPTYWRHVQKAELTRISQTLQLVPNAHWIVVEDSETKTQLVNNVLTESNLVVTHLSAKTPPFEQLKDKDPRWKRHRGVEQRNAGLKWLRENLSVGRNKGIVYFMDDDNTYDVKIFAEMLKIKNVGVWPVGLVGGLNAEAPILDESTGKVKGYKSGWKAYRPFAIDMAGFAINLELILIKTEATFSYKMEKGFQESEFLSYFVSKEELEPLADNCTKVYVWHTRTEKPVVNGIVPGLEV